MRRCQLREHCGSGLGGMGGEGRWGGHTCACACVTVGEGRLRVICDDDGVATRNAECGFAQGGVAEDGVGVYRGSQRGVGEKATLSSPCAQFRRVCGAQAIVH